MKAAKSDPPEDFDLNQLRLWTAEAHAGQTYENGPYTDHLDDGRAILNEFGFTEANHKHLHGAFELHDVFEDCKHTKFTPTSSGPTASPGGGSVWLSLSRMRPAKTGKSGRSKLTRSSKGTRRGPSSS